MMPDFSGKRERIREGFESFRDEPVESLKSNWAFLSVSFIFLVALQLRYMPEQGMKYLQALDPFWIFRQSQHLAYEGNIPPVDFMRYFPYNAPFHHFNNGEIIIPALLYKLGGFLFFDSYLEYAQFFPALMGALGVAVSYFLGKELYDRYAGVAAAFFLATIPGVLHRTSAGFFEKEPVGTLFMLLTLYFFTRAWRRKEHISGILSGLAFGIFTISWGGSQSLWILYPAMVGTTMLLNEDTRSLVIAYTPTVLLGGAFASIFNPSRFWFTSSFFLANISLLVFLWSRYLVEEMDLVREKNLKFFTPVMVLLGLVFVLTSRIFTGFFYSRFTAIINKISQEGGGVVAGTVSENQPASLGALKGELSANLAVNIISYLPELPAILLSLLANTVSGLANISGSWTLGNIGVVLAGTYVLAMVMRKTGFIEEEISLKQYQSLGIAVLFLWSMGFAVFFQGAVASAIAPAVLLVIGGMGILQALNAEKRIKIEYRWYYIIPLIWAFASIIAAVSKSRLIFLSAFPVALMAGFAFSRAVKSLKELGISKLSYLVYGAALLIMNGFLIFFGMQFTGDVMITTAAVLALDGILIYLVEAEGPGIEELMSERKEFRILAITVLVASVGLINFSAAFVNADSLGGRPNSLWQENLDYMREETPPGSVILSWWDYGYWFESVGRRAAIADGGNAGYYADGRKINYPLADFLTSDSPRKWRDWLDKHSVDYVVLDETMIGKYTAVSQIAHESNSEFRQMLQLSTSADIRRSLRRDSQNNTLVQFSRGRINLYMPVNFSSRDMELTGAPTLEAGGRQSINCMLTPEGIKEFGKQGAELPGRFFGYDRERVEVCAAINPFRNIRRSVVASNRGSKRAVRAVLVPRPMADNILVRLYLMDGHGMENFRKVPGGSAFGFVKMWEYTG